MIRRIHLHLQLLRLITAHLATVISFIAATHPDIDDAFAMNDGAADLRDAFNELARAYGLTDLPIQEDA